MTLAIVGRVGSGKTYAAKGMVETALHAGSRVCVVDPTGAWWGLRLAVNGVDAALPVVIFGGEHADVPIAPEDGARLAMLLVENKVGQCVVDVSEMTGGEQTRFLTPFFETLYAKNRAPLTLVLDEADMMAPQQGMPEQMRLKGATNKIIRRGRIKGFKPIMITQRPAVIDKSVLSQIDTLIAMKLTSPQDRKAIEEWVKGNADAGAAKKVLTSLASLKRGEGWYWAPSDDVLERRTFPAITTFDSSRAPDEGEVTPEHQWRALPGLDELRAALAPPLVGLSAHDVSEDGKLRAEIRRLGQEIVRIERESKATIAALYAAGDSQGRVFLRRGVEAGVEAVMAAIKAGMPSTSAIALAEMAKFDALGAFQIILQPDDEAAIKAAGVVDIDVPRIAVSEDAIADLRGGPIQRPGEFTNAPNYSGRPHPHGLSYRRPDAEAAAMTPTARKILDVIHDAFPVSLKFKTAAIRAGASPRSSSWAAHRKAVMDSGEVRLDGDRLTSTTKRQAPRGPLTDPVELFAAKLAASCAAMLRAIAKSRTPLTAPIIAERAGYSPTSSSLGLNLSELVAMELIVKTRGGYEIAPELRRDAG
jgi:hypothetical protein